MDRFKEYIRRVRELIRTLYSSDGLQSSDELLGAMRSEVSIIAFKMGIDEAMQKEAERAIRDETRKEVEQFTESHFVPASSIQSLTNEVGKIKGSFDRQAFEIVRRGVARGENGKIIQERLARLGRVKEQHYGTVQNTIRLGIARQGAIERSLANGVRYFRYSGASMGSRPFCRERIGKVYSIEDIRAMDNGQGLPVEFFCGGYNCRHRWVAFSGDVENGVAIHDSWKSEYNKGTKQAKAVMQKEKMLSEKLSSFGKIELNAQRGRKEEGDTDIYFDSKPTQLKQTESQRSGVFRDLARKGSKQADVVIIAHNGHPNEEEEIKAIKKWKINYINKKIYLYNSILNTLKEV